MNWLHFFLWITGIYGLYYAVIITLDIGKSRRSPTTKLADNELTFTEAIPPRRLEHNEEPSAAPSPDQLPATKKADIIGSGGVGIRDLFSLARQEAIIYTRPVSF